MLLYICPVIFNIKWIVACHTKTLKRILTTFNYLLFWKFITKFTLAFWHFCIECTQKVDNSNFSKKRKYCLFNLQKHRRLSQLPVLQGDLWGHRPLAHRQQHKLGKNWSPPYLAVILSLLRHPTFGSPWKLFIVQVGSLITFSNYPTQFREFPGFKVPKDHYYCTKQCHV